MLSNLLLKLKDLIKIKSVIFCCHQIDLQLPNKSKLETHKTNLILSLNKHRLKINPLGREKLILN